jgi:hypothetical protein
MSEHEQTMPPGWGQGPPGQSSTGSGTAVASQAAPAPGWPAAAPGQAPPGIPGPGPGSAARRRWPAWAGLGGVVIAAAAAATALVLVLNSSSPGIVTPPPAKAGGYARDVAAEHSGFYRAFLAAFKTSFRHASKTKVGPIVSAVYDRPGSAPIIYVGTESKISNPAAGVRAYFRGIGRGNVQVRAEPVSAGANGGAAECGILRPSPQSQFTMCLWATSKTIGLLLTGGGTSPAQLGAAMRSMRASLEHS